MDAHASALVTSSGSTRRVAYVFARSDLGGAEIATLRLMESHSRDRYVPVGVLMEAGAVARRLEDTDIEVVIAPALPRLSRRREREDARAWLGTQLHKLRIDLQHAVMAWTQVLAAPAAREAGVPAVWFQHNRPKRSSAIEWLAAASTCDRVLVNSQFTLRGQRRLNIRRRQLELIPFPIDVGVPSNTDLRRELGLRDESVLVILPGRLVRLKGQDVALRALSLTPDTLHLALVGDTMFGLEPDYRPHLEYLAESLGVQDRVHFVGFRDNMADVYDAADILLHTSRLPETFGLVVAEAKAHGCAVVAPDFGAVPELIRDGETGVLVPPEDHVALANVLARLGQDSGLRDRLAEAAQKDHVVTRGEAVERLEQVYDTVIDH